MYVYYNCFFCIVILYSIGGVYMSVLDDRISVENTIESRLNLCYEVALPQVRLNLFGPSPNRKFFS